MKKTPIDLLRLQYKIHYEERSHAKAQERCAKPVVQKIEKKLDALNEALQTAEVSASGIANNETEYGKIY